MEKKGGGKTRSRCTCSTLCWTGSLLATCQERELSHIGDGRELSLAPEETQRSKFNHWRKGSDQERTRRKKGGDLPAAGRYVAYR